MSSQNDFSTTPFTMAAPPYFTTQRVPAKRGM